MAQTFEYFEVDPGTWKDKAQISNIRKCKIIRDLSDETLGSAQITCEGDLTDKYIRIYLVTEQDGIKEKTALGTYIFETPSTSFDGRVRSTDQDGYTPLIELKEKLPQIGFTISKDENIVKNAYLLASEYMRAPVTWGESDKVLTDSFTAESDDTWLYFITDLLANASYHFGLEADGSVTLEPDQEADSLSPIWTYSDDNSSILLPDVEVSRDLYGVPNVVEVVYSPDGVASIFSTIKNDDASSSVSTVSRGREIVYRDTDPSISGADASTTLNQADIDDYARNLLKNLSSVEYTVSYKHGYCPVRIGDGVTSIGDSAFACCSGLTSVTIPDSVTSIGGGAFSALGRKAGKAGCLSARHGRHG